MDTVRRKVMVVAIVIALLSLAVVGVMNIPQPAKNTEINMLAQVNQNGSSVVFKDDCYLHKDSYFSIDKETNQVKIEGKQIDEWRGKIVGTPGVSTIQHSMMKTLIEQQTGLPFVQYNEKEGTSKDNVYFQASITDLTKWNDFKDRHEEFIGCIIWEYVASQIDKIGGGTIAIKSENIDDGHACCVIATNNEYLKNNLDATIRFLKAYINGVKDVQNYCKDGKVDENFLNWATEYVAGKKLTDLEKEGTLTQYLDITKSALLNVKYTFGNDDDPLGALRNDVAKFIINTGLEKSVKDQGYSNAYELANEIVDDTPLRKALSGAECDTASRTIAVTTITGDIHQIALHWANASSNDYIKDKTNYFAKEYITLKISNGANGSAVATSLQNGDANIGLMGVPPITSVIINSKLNVPTYFEITGKAVDADGKAIANAKVIFTPSSNSIGYEATTDAEGKFTLKVIKGTYTAEEGYYIKIGDKDVSLKQINRVTENLDLGEVKVV